MLAAHLAPSFKTILASLVFQTARFAQTSPLAYHVLTTTSSRMKLEHVKKAKPTSILMLPADSVTNVDQTVDSATQVPRARPVFMVSK